MSEPEPKTEEEQQAEKEAAEKKEDYDKAQQQADQEKANAQRARDERDTALTEKEEAEQQLSDAVKQRDDLEAKVKQKAQADQDGLDETMADPSVIKELKRLNQEVRNLGDSLGKATKKIDTYEKSETERKAKSANEQAKTQVIEATEKLGDFPVKYRNAAMALADSLVDSGKEKLPNGSIEAVALLSKCYKQVIKEEDEKDKTKSTVPTDSGEGGVSFDDTEKFKQGSTEDVLADMKKSGRYKSASFPKAE